MKSTLVFMCVAICIISLAQQGEALICYRCVPENPRCKSGKELKPPIHQTCPAGTKMCQKSVVTEGGAVTRSCSVSNEREGCVNEFGRTLCTSLCDRDYCNGQGVVEQSFGLSVACLIGLFALRRVQE